jgi:nucleoid-associated protein YgaU
VQVHDPPGPGFQGVVTALKEKYVLFDDQGRILRARVTLTLKSYKPAEVQLREINRQSPDRTHVRTLRQGERLDQLANEAYGNPRLWRMIADANNIDRPRFVPPGTPLWVPAIDSAPGE